MAIATHYDTLQVTRSASAEVIRAAYKSLSQRYHPDRYPPDERLQWEQRMKALNAAYAILSDPEKRVAYDEVLAASERMQQPRSQTSQAFDIVPATQPAPRAKSASPPVPPPASAASAASKHRSFRMTEPSKAETNRWMTVFGCLLVASLLVRHTNIGSWLASIDWPHVFDWKKQSVVVVEGTKPENQTVAQMSPQALAQPAIQAIPQGTTQFMPRDAGLQPVDMSVACYAKGDTHRLLPNSECVITVHNPNEHWFLRDLDLDVEVRTWANTVGRISNWTYPLSAMVMPGETRSYPFVVTISGNAEPRSFSWSIRNVSGEALPH